jgi:hypothetical protein
VELLQECLPLLNVHEKEVAESLLRFIHALLKQDKIFDKIQAEFTLVEINTQPK